MNATTITSRKETFYFAAFVNFTFKLQIAFVLTLIIVEYCALFVQYTQ